MTSLLSVAPTSSEASYCSGTSMELHAGPSLPAATTTRIPAARSVSMMLLRVSAFVQPSLGGQSQELLMMSGAFDGSGFAPEIFVGARKNWKHSVYRAGVPVPSSMLRQPIHLAPGATP